MNDVIGYLTSLAQALAKMSLYAEGHPARLRASEVSFTMLRRLFETNASPAFSFIGGDVVYGSQPVRELQGWDWARRLSSVGVQRVEFHVTVDAEEYRVFLNDVVTRLSAPRTGEARLDARTPTGGSELIRFGAVGLRRASDKESVETARESEEVREVDLSEEAEAVHWMHSEVASGRALPIAEAETVVQSLSAAMHTSQRILLPLLTLKEFDQYTTTHALNVAVLAMAIAEKIGLSGREARMYGMSGLLHDLGKVKVPVEVLRKPGVLTPEELALMRLHPMDGAKMILQHDRRLDLCAVVAFEHHIMIDGNGYPARQRRCDCHHASMLVHVCDVFDALRTNRPYRVAWETADIVSYITGRIGTEFEPTVTRAFVDMVSTLEMRVAGAQVIDAEFALAG